MAPEVINCTPYDLSADIWSLGCVWYELVSGRKPFTGSDYLICDKIVKGNFQPVSQTRFPKFEQAVMRMMVLDPQKRPTARELVAEFQEEI